MRKQRVIIMEGPDGCGKTEIGKGLARLLGIPYFRMDTQHSNWRRGRFKDCLEIDQPYILSFLEQTGHSCVIDRAYPSEWVYSIAFVRETNNELIWNLDRRFADIGTRIVIPWRENISAARSDELVPAGKLGEITELYKLFAERSECDVDLIQVDYPGIDCDLAEEISRLVKSWV